MKTKKYLVQLLQMLTVLMLCVVIAPSFVSCGDDDEPGDSSIVGSWTCDDHYYCGSDTFTFKKNGSYTWTYRGTADWFDDQKGTYTYAENILVITNTKGTTWVYIVVSQTNASMVLMDEDGDRYTYYKD